MVAFASVTGGLGVDGGAIDADLERRNPFRIRRRPAARTIPRQRYGNFPAEGGARRTADCVHNVTKIALMSTIPVTRQVFPELFRHPLIKNYPIDSMTNSELLRDDAATIAAPKPFSFRNIDTKR